VIKEHRRGAESHCFRKLVRRRERIRRQPADKEGILTVYRRKYAGSLFASDAGVMSWREDMTGARETRHRSHGDWVIKWICDRGDELDIMAAVFCR